MAKARTIQIFLPDGNPRGVKIAEITNRTVQTVFVPRVSVDFALSRNELDNVGVYFLVGESEDTGKPLVYIGETENCADRLRQHNKGKDFWQYALMMTSKTRSFTKSCVKYLEWYCHQQADKAGRFTLDNGTQPTEPHLSESRIADLMDNYDDIKTLVSALGYPIFDPVKKPSFAALNSVEDAEVQAKDILFCKRKDVYAEGEYTEEGLVVFKGAKCRKDIPDYASSWPRNLRQELIEQGVMVLINDDHYEFTEDHIFSSPSAAAVVVVGANANGWKEWKYKNGKTLDEVKRQG
ncbi:hypothetical protein LCGC14_2213940 [marine sediment metagenome]|uniref:DUF4357 domain-containing protein n=1 Tax=marine sediment metagenome TaxID=412755 RepID=A0A0F9E0F5_9ZZZZ